MAFKIRLKLFCLLNIFLIQLSAQESDSLKIYHLDDIIITATRGEKHPSDVSRSLSVISKTKLQNSVYLSPAELIGQEEGILVIGNGQTPGSFQNIYMRGANNNQTVIMIDGVRITDPSSVENTIDLSELSLANFDRIEIIRGSHSTLFGSSAIGGVINFVTEKNRKAGFNAEAYTRIGKFGEGTSDFTQNLFLNYTFNNGFYVNGEIFNSRVHGLDATVDTVTNPAVYNKRDKDNFEKTDFITKAGFINNSWDIFVSYKNASQKTDIDKRAYIDDDNYFVDFKRNLLRYYLAYKASENIKLSFNGGFSDLTKKAEDDSSVIDNLGNYDHAFNSSTFKGSILNNEIQANFNFDFGDAVLGFSSYKEMMTSKNYVYSASIYGIYESESNLDTLNIESTTNNIFAHLDIPGSLLGEQFSSLNLALGGRYTYHSSFGGTYTYEINPSYKISDRGIIYASHSTGFNAPPLYRLYEPSTNYISGIQRGNNNLKPEESSSYELGYRYAFSENGQFSIAIFNTKITNMHEYVYLWNKNIAIEYLGSDFLRDDYRGDTYINAGDMNTKGLEIGLSFNIMPRLFFSGNASWLKGDQNYIQNTIDKNYTDNYWVQVYANGAFLTENIKTNGLVRRAQTANLALVYTPQDKITLGLNTRFVGKRDDIFYDSQNGPYGALNTKTVNDYALFDLSARYGFSGKITATMRVENIFDKKYFEINGYSTRGRSVYFGLRYKL